MSKLDTSRIRKAVDILKNGGIIVYPTETVYGIGCDPFNHNSCNKIQRLKKRTENKLFLLLAFSRSQLEDFAGTLTGIQCRLADIFWPGHLTMVIKPAKKMPDYLTDLSGGVAFRVTSNPVAALLARDFGSPIISTSANVTGQSPIVTFEEAWKIFRDSTDIVLETTECLSGIPSTVIDLTSEHLTIIREGNILLSQIEEVL